MMSIRWGFSNRLLRAVSCAVAIACVFFLCAQSVLASIATDYTVRRWGVEDGLPEGIVTAVARFPDGFVWLTTPRHVVRFDGVEFEAFPPDAYPAEKPKRYNGIFRDRDGKVWVSGDDGVMRYDGDSWKMIPLEADAVTLRGAVSATNANGGIVQGMSSLQVFWVKEDAGGQIWAASNVGVFKYDGRKFAFVPPVREDAMGPFLSVAMVNPPVEKKNAGVTIWLLDGERLVVFDGQKYRRHSIPEGAVKGSIIQIFAGVDGALWARTMSTHPATGQFLRWFGGTWEERSCPGTRMSSFIEMPGGDVWLGSVEGVLRYHNDRWDIQTGSSREIVNNVRCLACSDNAGLWVGTENGLLYLEQRLIRMIPVVVRGQEQAITALLPRETNMFWAGVSYYSLWSGPADALAPCLSTNAVLCGESITALAIGADGALWFGTRGKSVWRVSWGGYFSLMPTSNWLGGYITTVFTDQRGRRWAGRREGLLRDDAAGWLQPVADGPEDAVLALCDDGAGGVWVGTQSSGLWRRSDGGARQVMRASDGLPSDSIRALYRDADGILWLATPRGLARVEEDRGRRSDVGGLEDRGQKSEVGGHYRVTTFGKGQGLPEDDIRQMLDDGGSVLWVGARQCILRLEKTELAEVAQGRKTVLTPRLFGRGAGLSAELSGGDNSGSGPLAVRTADGKLWFATRAGIAMLDPAGLKNSPESFPVYIQEIGAKSEAGTAAMWRQKPGGDGLQVFPAGSRDITFRFTSPCFSAPEHMLFRTWLEGYDSGWSKPMPQRRMTYSELAPGTYRFRVLASSPAGGWREAGNSVRFVVEPFFWQTWWFRVVVVMLAVSLAGLASGYWIRRRARREQERLENERAVERERARIARDLHDEIGAKLTRISYLGAMVGEGGVPLDDVRSQAVEMAGAARETHRAFDEIIWSINPRNDSVRGLAHYICRYTEEFLAGTQVKPSISLAGDLPDHALAPDRRHEVFMAVKEAVSNVLGHAGAHRLELKISLVGGSLEIALCDDGCGFDPALPVAGNGLRNMRERLTRAGGSCDISSSPGGAGTRIVFRLPTAL